MLVGGRWEVGWVREQKERNWRAARAQKKRLIRNKNLTQIDIKIYSVKQNVVLYDNQISFVSSKVVLKK